MPADQVPGIDIRVRGAIGPREADAIAAGCTNRGCLYRLSWAAASRQLPASRVANWRRLVGDASYALAMRNQKHNDYRAAANSPQTITNALMILNVSSCPLYPSEADIAEAREHVRYGPQAVIPFDSSAGAFGSHSKPLISFSI